MRRVIALVPVSLQRTPLGLPSQVSQRLAGRCVLHHAVRRAMAVPQVQAVVLVHPAGEDPLPLLEHSELGKPVLRHEASEGAGQDNLGSCRRAARAWALTAWRGGLGGATCYDELLPPAPLAAAMQAHQAESAVLLGGDWPLMDPDITSRVLAIHLENPESMQATFCQAPPGLAGVAVSASLLEQLTKTRATLGHILAYNPGKPQPDPIGRDVCLQIPPAVRSAGRRFIADTPRSWSLLRALESKLGPDALASADALQLAQASESLEPEAVLPQQVTLELTPRRVVSGPVIPQHHISIPRADMPLDLALRLVEQLGTARDAVLTLGGLGDALLHEHWLQVVQAAKQAGVLAVEVRTDLRVPRETLAALLDTGVDVVSVHLNADSPLVYEKVMGDSGFTQVMANIEWLLNERVARSKTDAGRTGIPWVVPRLIKTRDTLPDMERFFDRWMHFTGQAVIEPLRTGCGLMPAAAELIAQPRKPPCRWTTGIEASGLSLLVQSDGKVPWCDEDWLGRSIAGDAAVEPLGEIHARLEEGLAGEGEGMTLCRECLDWHRRRSARMMTA